MSLSSGMPTPSVGQLVERLGSQLHEEEWNLVPKGPPTSGIASSSKGGSFRESRALAKTFAEARKQLVQRRCDRRRQPDTPRYHSPEEANEQGLERLRQAIALLRQKAPEDVEGYGNFVREVARRVAEAHKEEAARP